MSRKAFPSTGDVASFDTFFVVVVVCLLGFERKKKSFNFALEKEEDASDNQAPEIIIIIDNVTCLKNCN